MLKGELTFQLGDERVVMGDGTDLNMPVGSVHGFKNERRPMARVLTSTALASMEEMFLEVGQPMADDVHAVLPPTEAEIMHLLEVADRYGLDIRVAHL